MTFEIGIDLVETRERMSKLLLTSQISLVKSGDVEQVLSGRFSRRRDPS